jgi:hypothetical protein
MALTKLLILRRPQSGRLEGRTALIQRVFDSFTSFSRGDDTLMIILASFQVGH